MSNLTSKPVILVASVCLVALIAVVWLVPEGDTAGQASEETVVLNDVAQRDNEKLSDNGKTVDDVWQWEPFEENLADPKGVGEVAEDQPQLNVTFDIQSIQNGLKTVKIDQYGDVVVNPDALNALNEVFRSGSVLLDDDAMTELQRLIRMGLAGAAGEQVATIVGNFNDYLRAKKEMYELMASSGGEVDHRALLDEQAALQELYMGKEVADKLFTAEDASARYMMESMVMAKDKTISDEERAARQEELREQYEGAQYGIENWASRYSTFKQEKQSIINSGLSQQDIKQQVQRLARSHFTQQELERISHMNLGGV
ncbi:lipase chaperone [Ketobacter sp. MCCC 1A13808]|uniref:lipase secretion chaperone n=1 Tax=Ketobacter sp. MCCC 1A13808 TaxID=2602738 RepID=UPI0012ECB9D1|nr:lipase secretion chaperone [Ketobacter sp. MCCC 1A13808]MVF13067.1 lipase chaperone [Ketobacter sp. MCCC 1A13808]